MSHRHVKQVLPHLVELVYFDFTLYFKRTVSESAGEGLFVTRGNMVNSFVFLLCVTNLESYLYFV